MKNIFLINPGAGKKKKIEDFVSSIQKASEETGINAFVYYTKYAGDGERFIRETCENHPENTYRFFGCGGDGTLNEVINGCYGYANAVAGNVPMGTGNDFIRSIGEQKHFSDISNQLNGKPVEIDLIRCSYIENDREYVRYCDNMINIGFDSNVVEAVEKIKKKGLASGSAAYLLGVAQILIKKKGADLKIELDGETVYDGTLLLTAVANGQFCGGGVHSAPLSKINDGVLESSIIKDISRNRFLRLFPSYQKGTHIDKLEAGDILIYNEAKKISIHSNGEMMRVSNDGELIYTMDIDLEVVPQAVKFSVPEVI